MPSHDEDSVPRKVWIQDPSTAPFAVQYDPQINFFIVFPDSQGGQPYCWVDHEGLVNVGHRFDMTPDAARLMASALSMAARIASDIDTWKAAAEALL